MRFLPVCSMCFIYHLYILFLVSFITSFFINRYFLVYYFDFLISFIKYVLVILLVDTYGFHIIYNNLVLINTVNLNIVQKLCPILSHMLFSQIIYLRMCAYEHRFIIIVFCSFLFKSYRKNEDLLPKIYNTDFCIYLCRIPVLFLHVNATLLYSFLLLQPEGLYLAFLILQVCHWTLCFCLSENALIFPLFLKYFARYNFFDWQINFFFSIWICHHTVCWSLWYLLRNQLLLIEDTLYESLLFCCLFLSLLKFDYNVLV